MIVVYLIPGLAASLALCLYVALMLILLAAFEVTLTLPGIAGIILSIGMAVDANVIIFTRIKRRSVSERPFIPQSRQVLRKRYLPSSMVT